MKGHSGPVETCKVSKATMSSQDRSSFATNRCPYLHRTENPTENASPSFVAQRQTQVKPSRIAPLWPVRAPNVLDDPIECVSVISGLQLLFRRQKAIHGDVDVLHLLLRLSLCALQVFYHRRTVVVAAPKFDDIHEHIVHHVTALDSSW